MAKAKQVKESKTSKQSNEKDKAKNSSSKKQENSKDKGKKQPGKVAKYFKDLKSEFNKVVWPSKKKVIDNTSVVLCSIIIMGVFVGLLDTGMFKLLQFVLGLGSE